MSDNPYAQPGPGYRDTTSAPPDARTSVLAVLSFVSGLAGLILCCIPVIGLLGVLFGVPALFSISASRGQKRGTGLAVTGVVLGLLGAALGTAMYFGVAKGAGWMSNQAEVMAHIEAQDLQQTQARFSTRVKDEVTAERLAAFRAAYHAEVGAFQGVPDSLLDFVSLYGEVGEQSRNRMGELGSIYDSALPVAAEFDQQPAIVVPALDEDSGPALKLLNVGVLLDDGAIIWLLPAPGDQTAPGPGLEPSPEAGEPGEATEEPGGEDGGGGDGG